MNELLEKHNLSRRWLASRLGTNHASINYWLNEEGGAPRSRDSYDRMLAAIQEAVAPVRLPHPVQKTMVMVPVRGNVRAGIPEMDQVDVDYEAVPSWPEPERRWFGRVKGDSMNPTLLHEDLVLVAERSWEINDVVEVHDEEYQYMVKTLRKVGGKLCFCSFNDEFEPIEMGEKWTITGVIVARVRYGAYRSRSFTEFPGGLRWAMRGETF